MSDLKQEDFLALTGNDFRVQLKTATAAQHQQLEEQELLHLLMSASVGVDHYYYYLLIMQQITQTYERRILPVIADLISTDYMRSATLIEADLQKLEPLIKTKVEMQRFNLKDEEFSVAAAFGFAYVMEGSKLGGKVILKHLEKSLPPDCNCFEYLTGSGPATGMEWRSFLDKMSDYAISKNKGQEIIDAAISTFDLTDRFFETNKSVYGN